MLRRFAKAGLASGLRRLRADSWIGSLSGRGARPLVVGYHRVIDDLAAVGDGSLPGMVIRRSMLEAHLEWVGRHYRILPLDELGARIASGEPIGEPLAAITFDDGYADLYHNALPLLRRMGIPASVFVVTDVVGSERLCLHDSLYLLLARLYARHANPRDALATLLADAGGTAIAARSLPRLPSATLSLLLDRLPYAQGLRLSEALEAAVGIDDDERVLLQALSWPMLLDLQRAGIAIASHGCTHALLPNESPETVRRELTSSRAELELRLGVPIRSFAYPGGRWDASATAAVAAAGYSYAFTICSHTSLAYPRLTIPRRMLWEQSCLDSAGRFSEAVMSCHAQGVFDLMRGCRPRRHEIAGRAATSGAFEPREARG